MPRVPAAGNSYIEIDDSGGTPRNLSGCVEEVEAVGKQVSAVDITGLNDETPQVVAGLEPVQQFTLRGLFDDTPVTGSDAVLSGIVGKVVTVSYGPAGNATGQRKISGEFLCHSYQVGSRLEGANDVSLVRFLARFQQSGSVTLGTWA